MNNVCYRIYTEYKNRAGLESLVSKFFPSFTMIEGTGYYGGIREDCLIIEIILPAMPNMDPIIQRLGNAIALYNTQNSVLITKSSVELV